MFPGSLMVLIMIHQTELQSTASVIFFAKIYCMTNDNCQSCSIGVDESASNISLQSCIVGVDDSASNLRGTEQNQLDKKVHRTLALSPA